MSTYVRMLSWWHVLITTSSIKTFFYRSQASLLHHTSYPYISKMDNDTVMVQFLSLSTLQKTKQTPLCLLPRRQNVHQKLPRDLQCASRLPELRTSHSKDPKQLKNLACVCVCVCVCVCAATPQKVKDGYVHVSRIFSLRLV
jgi:hypothetical protein